jgi:hypothetical protein
MSVDRYLTRRTIAASNFSKTGIITLSYQDIPAYLAGWLSKTDPARRQILSSQENGIQVD